MAVSRPLLDAVEALAGAGFAGKEWLVGGIDVAGDELGAVGVSAGDEDGGHVADVGGEAGGDEFVDRFLGGDENFAAHVSALLGGAELVLEVDRGGSAFDHSLHQLEGVEGSAESGFGVGDQRSEPVLVVLAFLVPDLVGAQQSVVDAAAELGDGIGRVEALIGIDLAGGVGVAGDLPAADVDGVESGLDHLNGLVAGHCAQSLDVGAGLHEFPKALGAEAGEGVLDVNGAAQTIDVGCRVSSLNAAPACIGIPGSGDVEAVVVRSHCRISPF